MRRFYIILILALSWVFASSAYAENIRVLVFGDSLASGYGLPEEGGMLAQLERAIREAGYDVELVNAGIMGDTSASALARAKKTLAVPHDALILELGANDMLLGRPPEKTQENLSAILEEVSKPIYILGMRAIPNYGENYAQAFDGIYPALAKQYRAGLYPFIMQPIFDQGLSNYWRYMQRDMMHMNEKGVEIVVEALAPEFISWMKSEKLVR